MARLIMRRGPTPDAIFDITGETFTIGSGTKNDVVITDNEVSREHCRFVQVVDDYELQDLDAERGTYVNGQRITENWLLRTRCFIELGHAVTFEFIPAEDIEADPDSKPTRAEFDPENPPSLVLLVASDRKDTRRLTNKVLVIGRESACDLVIQDPEVSRRHAQLVLSDEGYVLQDLGSTNGIMLNQRRVTEDKLLRANDIIQIGTAVELHYTWKPEQVKGGRIHGSSTVDQPTPTRRGYVLEKSAGGTETLKTHILGESGRPKTGSLDAGDSLGLRDHVFIAYAREDWEAVVKPLIAALEEANIKVWVDQEFEIGTDDWLEAVEQALRECWMLAVVVSPQAIESRHVRLEYRYFFNREKPILPLLYKPVEQLPPQIDETRAVRFDPNRPGRAYKAMLFEIMHMPR